MSRFRRVAKWTAIAAVAVAVILVVAVAGGYFWIQGRLEASLPQLDGSVAVEGLSAPVTVERDDLGVPTIRAANRADVARATGFLHAQERYFQMDLLRRRAAGELSELFGPQTLDIDRDARLHRFRALAKRGIQSLSEHERSILEAYVVGVNSGLEELGEDPFEYVVMRVEPAPWVAEDTLLVVYAMYFDLQDETGRYESTLGLMHDLLPDQLVEFLVPDGTEWDAPLIGEALATPAVPSAEVFDLRPGGQSAARRDGGRVEEMELHPGSNSWAVAGDYTADGGAWLANDMHLGLGLPNIWYRARFEWRDGDGTGHEVTGVTLPGVPPIVAGSNGHVAWGFTNTELDLADLVVLEEQTGGMYEALGRLHSYQTYTETIRVKEADDEPFDAIWTVWGPVIDEDHEGRKRAVRWIAHDPGAVDFGLLEMERARGVDQAMDIANRTGIPTQNCVVADREGRIGWTLMGPVPQRKGLDGTWPSSWSGSDRYWDGWLAPEDYPRVVDPKRGRIWTANNRVVGPDTLERIGTGSFALGARAAQIRDRLLELDKATAEELQAIQLDDRAVLLDRWRVLLLDQLDDEATLDQPKREELRRAVTDDWTGHASVDSSGYRMVRAFRLYLADQVFGSITAACAEADEGFRFTRTFQWEGPLWRLVNEQPRHLLHPMYESWDEQFLSAVDKVIENFSNEEDARALDEYTWGARNTVTISHPISGALPEFLDSFADRLDAPAAALPGDALMPRVQGVGFGASERFVVSPGREEAGMFHMPGGQSGHPYSPYYLAGHESWVQGLPAPFLPGATAHTLTLTPK